MLYIRARSTLHLREIERDDRPNGYRLNLLIQLDDNQPAQTTALGAATASSRGEPEGLSSDESARSFAGQRISLELFGNGRLLQRTLVYTDTSGAASYRFSGLPVGRYRILARYDGDIERDSSQAVLDVDFDKRPVELDLNVSSRVGIAEPIVVKAALRIAGQPQPGRIALRVGDNYRAMLQLDQAGGSDSIRLLPRPLPGTLISVEARFAGDEQTASALSRREVQITTQARVTVEISTRRATSGVGLGAPLEIAQGERLSITGTAFDETGPLIGEAVDIEAGEGETRRRLGSVLTDGNGRYQLEILKLPLRPGAAFISAVVTPQRHYIRLGRSAELPIQVLPPEPVSLLYFLLPVLLSSLLLLGIWSGQKWLPRLLAWRARRHAVFKATSAAAASEPSAELPLCGTAGVTLGARNLRGPLTLRRTVDSTISGVVSDAVFGATIAEAKLQCISVSVGSGDAAKSDEATGLVESSTAEGRFAFSQLPAGRYLLRSSAPGYLPEEFVANLPHRGELQGLIIRMMPLRVRIHAQWQRVAAAFYGDEARLPTRTPRELLRDVQEPLPSGQAALGTRPAPGSWNLQALQRLTMLVEQSYYSGRLCADDGLQEATALADALLSQQGAPPTLVSRAPNAPRPELRAPGAPRPLSGL